MKATRRPVVLVPDPLAAIEKPFVRRLRSPRAWTHVAYTMPRLRLALLLALVPAALVGLAFLLGPPALERALTEPQHNRDVLSRYISAIVTAATIAVSFATLALRRGIQGVGGLQRHMREDDEYRRDVRRLTGRGSLPLAIGPFLANLLDDLAPLLGRIRGSAGADGLARERDGATLGSYLDAVGCAAERTASSVREASARPTALLMAALDFETEASAQLARGFRRDETLPEPARAALADLEDHLERVSVARGYSKTLVTQWGLSRMSTTITLTSFAAVVTATFWGLGYDEYVREAVGVGGAGALLAGVAFLLTLPLAAFVSHALRFIFLNEKSLPIGDFVLGPELVDLLPAPRGAPRRSA